MQTEELGPVIKLILSLLAAAFIGWAGVVWKVAGDLTDKFDAMMAEFRIYSISTEHRLTRLEETDKDIIEALKRMQEEE